MSRKKFIQAHGADCKNWIWSWSFVNHQDRFVVFGIWQDDETKKLSVILHRDWKKSGRDRISNGYVQAIEHIRLIEVDGYQLKTFPMRGKRRNPADGKDSVSQITEFTRELTNARLISLADAWHASHDDGDFETIPEIVAETEFWEGAVFRVQVNAYERNVEARSACLKHFGYTCQACQIDFGKKYGPLGEGYIHVHHIKPIHQCGGAYKVDPINDLIPVCANCHAMIHRTMTPLTVAELRGIIESREVRD